MKIAVVFTRMFLIAVLSAVCISIFANTSVSAYENNTSPAIGHSTYPLAHLTSSASYINVQKTELTIYSTSSKIGVAIAGADMCTKREKVYDMVDNYGSKLDGVSGAITYYYVNGTPAVGSINTSCTDGNNVMQAGDPTNVSLNRSTKLIIANSTTAESTTLGTMYKFTFLGVWSGACNYSATANCGVNYFRVKAMGISSGVFDNSKVIISQRDASDGGTSAQSGLGGYGYADDIPVKFSEYEVEFGANCTVSPTGSPASIDIYDDDNKNGPGAQDTSRPFGVRLEQRVKTKPGTPAAPWTVASGTAKGIDTISATNESGGNPTGNIPAGNGNKPGILGRNDLVGGWLQVGTYGSRNHLYLNFTAFQAYEYRLTVHDLDPHNNLQFSYPFGAIKSYQLCGNSTTIPPGGRGTVIVTPTLTGNLDEATDTATFKQGATVQDFPEVQNWGYNEVARSQAYNTNTAVIQKAYDANRDTKYNGVAVRKCDTGWAATCKNYECGRPPNVTVKTSCNVYHYRCEWGANGSIYIAYDQYDTQPACAEEFYQYQCKNASNQWYNAYVNQAGYGTDGCSNKWVCPNPSQIPSTHNPADFDGRPGYCKIFKCAYNPDGVGLFFDDNGDPDNKCEKRCSGGAGIAPVLWASRDFNCYISPVFYIQCNWDAGGGSTNFEAVTYTNANNGTVFCANQTNTTITRSTPNGNGEICADTTPTAANGALFNWLNNGSTVPPGKGQGADVNTYRATWDFNVLDIVPLCYKVGARPYFSVLGGDIAAGPGFKNTNGTCTTNSADIIGSASVNAPYNGAGAQLAALALGSIKSFATSHTQNAVTGGTWVDSLNGTQSSTATALSFANTSPYPVNTAGGDYGGSFGKNDWCVPDYYNNATADTTLNSATIQADNITDIPAGTTRTYYVKGPIKLNSNGNNIPARGQKVILKVEGDVYIDSPPNRSIQYENAASLALIPQFQVLAKGNIYVSKDLSRLDGFYDAQGDDLRGGLFATCAQATGPVTFQQIRGVQAVSDCRTIPLTVNGSIAAKTVMLNRTLGDRNPGLKYGQPQTPAETFVFSPQFWLPSVTREYKVGAWQSVTSLPPIL